MATETSHRTDPVPPDDASLHMQLEPSEPLDIGLRRLALEQLDVVADGFSLPADDAELGDRVHRARKASKRVRALLRLVRDDIGKAVYRNENAVVRDQAKRLSDLRIAEVMIETANQLAAEIPGSEAEFAADFHDRLAERRDRLIADFRTDTDGRAAARTALACARSRIEAWPGFNERDGTSPSLCLVPGFVRAYARGRRAMKVARNTKTAEDSHDWRKQVNYLRYQIEALRGRLPADLEALGPPLSDLSETLGAEHDLVDLARAIEVGPAPPDGSTGDHQAVLAAIEQRRCDLQLVALRAGREIYREHPDRVAAELTAIWETC